MFTKCPECNISFRVTAKVLQQANGNVRCGGCSHAFNALNYLSEEMPASGLSGNETDENDELAETSRRLLETLDELAGPDDVLIEDTGVEWRVLDQNDADDDSEMLNVTEEMRYDDSTQLPDDFGMEDGANFVAAEPIRRTSDHEPERTPEFDAAQQDLLLSEPGEWTDLLDEVTESEPATGTPEVEEAQAANRDALDAWEGSSTGEYAPADIDTQFNTQAEAMGLDNLSSEDALTDQFPLLSDDSVVADNLDDIDDGDDEIDDDGEEIDAHYDFSTIEDDVTGEFPVAGMQEAIANRDEVDDDVAVDEVEDDEFEDESLTDAANEDELREVTADDVDALVAVGEERSAGFESTGEFQSQIEVAARALAGADESDAEEVDVELDEMDILDAAREATDDDNDEEEITLEPDDDSSASEDSAAVAHIVPELTEEEMTVNMEIDQEMMAAAIQDDDFSATLVGLKNPEQLFEDNAATVETIIMEGEDIRGSIEKERLDAEHAAKNQLDDPESFADTYAMRQGKFRGGRRRYDPTGYGATVAIIVLVLMLAGQYIHNSRESLATSGLFNRIVAPVYRMLGSPVTPSWDIKGWQFEVTNGSVDDAETTLTIVSRIVNKAAEDLPYPLVHVSLTDRWEEDMGSRILEPADYLAGDLDPSSPVLPGEKFTAVITIENPSVEATGFKLNVCYRVSPGTVRCAIEDFKY